MQLETHIRLIGWLLIFLASIHVAFPRYFRWKAELASLSLINRQMMIVHTFFIGLVVLLMGMLCVCCAEDLKGTAFGRKISSGLAIFWTVRMGAQFFGYSPVLWKGKRFETAVHVLFSLFWIYLSVIFWIVVFRTV